MKKYKSLSIAVLAQTRYSRSLKMHKMHLKGKFTKMLTQLYLSKKISKINQKRNLMRSFTFKP